jgi:hypothetical protein
MMKKSKCNSVNLSERLNCIMPATMALIIILFFTMTISDIAKAGCPPDDGCGIWTEYPDWIQSGSPLYYQQAEYKFCYRFNICDGVCETYISQIMFPPGNYDPDLNGSNTTPHYFTLCTIHLSDNFYSMKDADGAPLCGEGEGKPCGEGEEIMLIVGHAKCVTTYGSYDPILGQTVLFMSGCENCPDVQCSEKFSYCLDEDGILHKTSLGITYSDPDFTCPSPEDCIIYGNDERMKPILIPIFNNVIESCQ